MTSVGQPLLEMHDHRALTVSRVSIQPDLPQLLAKVLVCVSGGDDAA
jgi:hypothetical protein